MRKGPYREIYTKPRYLKQSDTYSCGPIALMNALKWAGYNITYQRDFKRICRATKVSQKYGASAYDMDIAVRRYKKLIVLPEDEGPFEGPSINLIDEHLSLGGSFIIGYTLTYKGKVYRNHYCLCIGQRGKQYVLVNNGKRTITNVNRNLMVRMLRTKDEDGDGSDVWFLFRLDNLTTRK